MNPQLPQPPDLLEQAHLAFLQGHWEQARSLLDRLVLAEPGNAAAQSLRATVIGKQAALSEEALLQATNSYGAGPQAQTGSIWTRPIPDPMTTLGNSSSARKWPKPLLLLACLAAGVLVMLLPGRHYHSYHSSWTEDVVFGLLAGATLFVWIVRKTR